MLTMREYMMQGEERDSSDDEWGIAYAQMDPASQFGWRNRRGAAGGPAEQLLRDVFAAADELHSDAMSEMISSKHSADREGPLHTIAAEEGCLPPPGNEYRSTASSGEVDQEGRTACAPTAKALPLILCT
jgi:hypothetical protein